MKEREGGGGESEREGGGRETDRGRERVGTAVERDDDFLNLRVENISVRLEKMTRIWKQRQFVTESFN